MILGALVALYTISILRTTHADHHTSTNNQNEIQIANELPNEWKPIALQGKYKSEVENSFAHEVQAFNFEQITPTLNPTLVSLRESEVSFANDYFTHLFESFGSPPKNYKGNENPLDFSSERSINKKSFQNVNSATIPSTKYDTDELEVQNGCDVEEKENCKNRMLYHKEKKNFLYDLISTRIGQFIPEIVKTNISKIKRLLVVCYPHSLLNGNSFNCLKIFISNILDKAIHSDVIQISNTVSLIKDNQTDDESRIIDNNSRSILDEVIGDTSSWKSNLIEQLETLFTTHSLKIRLANNGKRKVVVEGRRRYRNVFPIMVGAYMILSTVLIPLGFKFMIVLGALSIIISKLSLLISSTGSIRRFMGYSNEHLAPLIQHYPPLYHQPVYPPYSHYYIPWRKEDYRKTALNYEDPTEYSHYTEFQ